MVVNPALKPKVATTGLVLTSAVVLIFLALVPLAILASELPTVIKIVLASVLLASALMLLWLWWKRYAQRRTWTTNAEARWRSFNNARVTGGTTTEVTLLSIDAVQPTGSWVTIMWNRFNHIQPAWIEPLPEPVWVGHVLLIAPDPTQVMPGAPWPATYFIRAADCLAWAPAEGRHP